MKIGRYLRTILIAVVVLILVAVIVVTGLMQGWQIKKRTPDQLASLLTPYFKIKTPPGKGPFPTILCFHGATGLINPDGRMWKGAGDFAEYLAGLGYATIYIDSFTGRSIPSIRRNDLKLIMLGYIEQQPGDVLVAISEARKLSFVDKEQLALVGRSSGALAIMDTFAMNPPQEIPANLINAPDNPLAGVKAAILFYPYCGAPAKAKVKGGPRIFRFLCSWAGKIHTPSPVLKSLQSSKTRDGPSGLMFIPPPDMALMGRRNTSNISPPFLPRSILKRQPMRGKKSKNFCRRSSRQKNKNRKAECA